MNPLNAAYVAKIVATEKENDEMAAILREITDDEITALRSGQWQKIRDMNPLNAAYVAKIVALEKENDEMAAILREITDDEITALRSGQWQKIRDILKRRKARQS